MKVALVHDYLNEFGGAERVLLALSEMYPKAPIYTAFYRKGSSAYERFKDKDIRPSWAQKVPFFASKLHSPLRFLAPSIWESFDFDKYDVVITSASWYVTKGVITRPKTVNICYCHTPPRYLYGYRTAIEWQKYWPVRAYALVVNHYMRKYDFLSAQRVDYFVANSENVRRRIEKFYRREAEVIYPPVWLGVRGLGLGAREKQGYFLTGGRLVGAKNFDLVVKAARKMKVKLKVFGDGPLRGELEEMASEETEFLGKVSEEELAGLYAGAKAFVALAEDEDFGITPVEAMMAGTPVVAFRGGGYVETVKERMSGVFVDRLTVAEVVKAMGVVERSKFEETKIKRYARKFSKERFKVEMGRFVEEKLREHRRG